LQNEAEINVILWYDSNTEGLMRNKILPAYSRWTSQK